MKDNIFLSNNCDVYNQYNLYGFGEVTLWLKMK